MGLSLKKIANIATFGLGGDFVQELWDDFTGKTAVDRQNQYNLEMWRMQNEYNTPANQMKRYLEAGLNPNLIYSQGNSGNASSAPEMTAHQGSAAKALELSKFVLGLKNMAAQNRNLNAQTGNINAQTQQHLSDVAYKTALLDFYDKHGYFPGQTGQPVNVIREVMNSSPVQESLGPVANVLGTAKGYIVKQFSAHEYDGRANDIANRLADKKGLTGDERKRYIQLYKAVYNQVRREGKPE